MSGRSVLLAMSILGLVGCGGDSAQSDQATPQATQPSQAAQSAPAPSKRGGSVTIGDQSWVIVPSVQCGVYPGEIVSIAGHAESDADLEIVIDHDPSGRSGVRVGGDGQSASWHSVPETLELSVRGRQVQGSATFSAYFGGAGETKQGTFKVDC